VTRSGIELKFGIGDIDAMVGMIFPVDVQF